MNKIKLPYRFKTEPYKHQLSTWDESKDLKEYAVLWEMGVGKTKLALDTAAYLYDTGKITAVLVFSNKGSYRNWITDEVPVHMPDHIRYAAHAWDNRKTKKATEALRSFVLNDNGLKIFAMNIEALAHKRSAAIAHKFARMFKTLTIIDESTTIKNHKAKRSRTAKVIASVSLYKRILTGMMVENSPLDIYSQCEFLGPWLLGFSSYYAFRSHYAYLTNMKNAQRSWKVVTGYKNIEELKRKLYKFSSIIKSEDCLDLPPQTWQKYEIDLTPEQKQIYAQVRDEAIAQLSGGEIITAPMALTRMLKLHQITCGFIKDEDGVVHDIPNNRMSALDALLDETDSAIIWAVYRHNIQKITEYISNKYGEDSVAHYYGDTTNEERDLAKKNFQSGKIRFLVGNQQTAGYGLTLTRANVAIYFSNDYSYGRRAQSEKRCHRIGQTRSVNYVDIVARKTIDNKILTALKNKKSLSGKILVSNWSEIF